MTVLSWSMFFISLLVIAIGSWWGILNHRRYKANLLVADELDTLIRQTLETIKEQKNMRRKSHNISGAEDLHDLDSPAVLSTLVTVLVRKHGDIRLGLKDFTIPDEEYVSVYVDTANQELILSLNHDLANHDLYSSMVAFNNSDDNTFH